MNKKRKTLQKIVSISAVAIVMPGSWIKPIVSSVVLPAHAQTSGCPFEGSPEFIVVGQNYQCVVGSPNQVTYEITNVFGSDIEFVSIESDPNLTSVSPVLPFTLVDGATASFTVTSTQNNVANCPSLQRIDFAIIADGCDGFFTVIDS